MMSNSEVEKILASVIEENQKHQPPEMAKNKELLEKRKVIDEYNINAKYDSVVRAQKSAEMLNELNIDVEQEAYQEELVRRNNEYFAGAKSGKIFLDKQFRGSVPYFAKNLILIGAKSGNGKSTIAANLAYNALMNGQKALIITNEEAEEDFYNRIMCLIQGWHYVDHDKFTDHQKATFNKGIKALSERIMVISDAWQGRDGVTTTLEGITGVLNSAKRSKNKYDVIIIDYYQGVNQSLINPGFADWQVQQEFSTYLNGFFKTYTHGPVIVLSQLKENDENAFKDRIEGRKSIFNRATCAIEVKPNFEKKCTEFWFYKARHNQCIGKKLQMGYDKGKYVPYDDDFALKVDMEKQRALTNKQMGEVKPGGLNDKKD